MFKNRKTCGLLVVVLLLSSFLSSIVFAEGNQVKVTIDGKQVSFTDQQPMIENDRTLVPMRVIFESLGATIDWNEQSQTVTAKKGTIVIILKLGSNIASKNGTNITLDVPAKTINDRTMVPLRFVGESLGADVKWVDATQTVQITTPKTTTASATPIPTTAAPKPTATPAATTAPVSTYDPNVQLTGSKLKIAAVTTSQDSKDASKEMAIDGNIKTRWASQGVQWIMFDLGEVKKLTGFRMAWLDSKNRIFKFTITISEDGVKWIQVGPKTNSGTTDSYEQYAITETSAKYIKYTGNNGSNVNTYNSLMEFEAYGN